MTDERFAAALGALEAECFNNDGCKQDYEAARADAMRNRRQGCSFYWMDDTLRMTPKCCPYPLRSDWSAKACNEAGDCGCVKGDQFKRGSRRWTNR